MGQQGTSNASLLRVHYQQLKGEHRYDTRGKQGGKQGYKDYQDKSKLDGFLWNKKSAIGKQLKQPA